MKAGRHEADFAHSLTDLMSGVAVMFLVIAAIFMVQASRAKRTAEKALQKSKDTAAQNAKLAEQNADAAKYLEKIKQRDVQGIKEIESLRDQLAKMKQGLELDYDPDRDPRLLTIVFNRDNLNFASGDCEVAPPTLATMHGTLKQIFPAICETVGSTTTGLQKSITLEGHTDNEPPLGVRCPGVASADACTRDRKSEACKTQGLESNVQLSAARAQYVFFQARKALKDDVNVATCLDRNFIVAGRGPMDPRDGDRWDKWRSPTVNERNRRVVIKVRVMAASVERGTTSPARGTP